ncbi:hypothetical protein M3G00_00995 [Brevibacterium casei]|nr:hypothetical protein [Brevibacterium casei]MCT2181512.1 hypothetical protein [Brevibacterium casei]MDH5147683.1 hypothetical protein [Brevibacterium casei]
MTNIADVSMRSPAEVCRPTDMGGARATRHSFARQLIRKMSLDHWTIRRTVFELDDLGRGTAAYEISASQDQFLTLALFSQVISEDARTDRVIAERWDVTGALVEGSLDAGAIEDLRSHVTVQEEGRAMPSTVIWGRANRSVRFFDQVVNDLAAGRQPNADILGLSPYLLRSTAFYSNGKFGMRDFEGFAAEHVLAVPYRAHMIAAWLFREFSLDLAEHCARAKNPGAASFDEEWARYFGLGNATGLGLVPYVVNHPEILDAWLWSREFPLATALDREDRPSSEPVFTVATLLERIAAYLRQQGPDEPVPFTSGERLAESIDPMSALVREYVDFGTMNSTATATPWRTLHDAADRAGPEVRGIVATVITELTGDLDSEVEASLVRVEDRHVDPKWRIGHLRDAIGRDYSWIDEFDFSDSSQTDRFWFTSATSEEPRRGCTGSDEGLDMQHGVNVAEEIHNLRESVASLPSDLTVAEFLVSQPRFRAAVARVQKVGPLRFGELRANLRSSGFLPLNPQRLQLAVYGMDNYNPQSTDWLRVTLFSGAPRVADINAGTADDDWMFPLRPESNHRAESAGKA